MLQALTLRETMILSRKICFNELSEKGRDFNWGGHDCENCLRPMWGHGFVGRYVSDSAKLLWMKRYRCAGCGSVATARPQGYWPRVRSSIRTVFETLRSRIQTGRWPNPIFRQRAGHWLKAFVIKVRMDFSDRSDLEAVLSFCFENQISFLRSSSK